MSTTALAIFLFGIFMAIVLPTLIRVHASRRSPSRRFVSISIDGLGDLTMSFNIIQGAKKIARLNLADPKGVFRPLPAGVIPVWTVDDALVELAPADDGLSCEFTALDADGPFNLTATVTYADGDVVTTSIAGVVVDPEDTQATITIEDEPAATGDVDAATGTGDDTGQNAAGLGTDPADPGASTVTQQTGDTAGAA